MPEKVVRSHDVGAAGRMAIALVVSVALCVGLSATAGNAAGEPCRVRNVSTGQQFNRLQPAISAATAGNRIEVRGTCRGSAIVDRDLVIKGRWTRAWGSALLEGSRTGAYVISVRADVKLTLSTLVMIGNRADRYGTGGALLNHGTTLLKSARVRGQAYGTAIVNQGALTFFGTSRAADGVVNHGEMTVNDKSRLDGGMRAHVGPWGPDGAKNYGVLTLNDTSRVSGNRGHGVFNGGTLVLNGASRIVRNGRAAVYNRGTITMNGSSRISRNSNIGVYIQKGGTLTMNERSWISQNSAINGAGVFLRRGTLTMNDDSRIRYNHARRKGGGIYVTRATLSGVRCGPSANANVRHNKPHNCYFE